jgi:hypothetical protein
MFTPAAGLELPEVVPAKGRADAEKTKIRVAPQAEQATCACVETAFRDLVGILTAVVATGLSPGDDEPLRDT